MANGYGSGGGSSRSGGSSRKSSTGGSAGGRTRRTSQMSSAQMTGERTRLNNIRYGRGRQSNITTRSNQRNTIPSLNDLNTPGRFAVINTNRPRNEKFNFLLNLLDH